ncbi:MAG: ABC transporter ATP-binding protein [Pleomorphochaeta sp.]
MSKLEFSNITKIYDGGVKAVDDFNLEIKDGEFVVLVGPSGCGKSTMLRMVAGLESITSGTFSMDGKVVNKLPPIERDISLVFQNYALYGNMSIYDNVGMSLKVRHKPKVEIYDQVMKTSEFLGIKELLNRFPNQLSGGQKQRVALGRSISRNPKLFLMDEPLSNLDAKLRTFTRGEIVRIQRELDITTLYVTHDQIEAMTMADRIVIMKNGIIQQVGKPTDVYNRPSNQFVAGFIGMPPMNIIKGSLKNGCFIFKNKKIELNENVYNSVKAYEGKDINLGFRSEDVEISTNEKSFSAKVLYKEYLGGCYSLFLEAENHKITATVSEKANVEKEKVNVEINQDKMHFFDTETTLRIN